mmetsp:Transcript_12925/g.21115  ORF Transcript_12925/g.21115 Transcript_12925/m.21115 type:complete len:380 (+) Transcript_12925:122-1261(+)|eukprot:CAMPEP_0114422652 /NCGR_PEP_ID=MMETSP0103-20121206/5721_1 /TAXON_ID=37642 ORGANISM="Paraphysomonas imperforata, Strain PA2" /NCGR_SAMPLE_ID=MMETSP0103 /ASSEMBLY_ACC=CAM_ASM_000201 /LENGTH=379 /DNA_ID=CAMNT_0001591245 /DNA_START=38 /DNA_END=1177 /DNA_ORIENTATION=-
MGPKLTKSPSKRNEEQYLGLSRFGALPINFIQHTLDSDLLSFLQSDPFFQTPEENLTKVGYSQAIDYPDLTGHIYYEGYYHGRATYAPYNSVHPRYGFDFDKPPASLRLTSFIEALRRVNSSWTDEMISALKNMSPGNPAAKGLVTVLEENRHFADLSSQIHFGDEVPGTRALFHNDAPNSFIHVALSINGRRSLFWKGSNDPDFAEDVKVTDTPRGYITHEEKQMPGSVYLSSPYIVSHGVGYRKSSWDDRIIAVQCRCLFTGDEYDAIHKATTEEWQDTMTIVSDCLARRRSAPVSSSGDADGSDTTEALRENYIFRLPTLAEVLIVHDELLPVWNQGDETENQEQEQREESPPEQEVKLPPVSLLQFMKQNPPPEK